MPLGNPNVWKQYGASYYTLSTSEQCDKSSSGAQVQQAQTSTSGQHTGRPSGPGAGRLSNALVKGAGTFQLEVSTPPTTSPPSTPPAVEGDASWWGSMAAWGRAWPRHEAHAHVFAAALCTLGICAAPAPKQVRICTGRWRASAKMPATATAAAHHRTAPAQGWHHTLAGPLN